jgi:proteasome lid subunit RPN8/RPN11
MPAAATALTPDWSPAVIDALYREAFQSELETAGVLVGRPTEYGAPQITAVIPAVRAQAPGQRALLGHEAWAYVHDAMARHYATEEIVGWYRSRPGGTEMAPEDLANHLRFFPQPWHVAFLFDATAHRGAVYALRDGVPAVLHKGRVTPRTVAPGEGEGIPWRAMGVLAVLGLVLGAVLWLAASAAGLI